MTLADKFNYYIVHPDTGESVEVNPVNNTLGFGIEYSDDFGYYRLRLTTELIFNGDDFATLYAIEQSSSKCEKVLFSVEKKNSDAVWNGHLPLARGKWFKSHTIVRITPEIQDQYTALLENWNTKRNLLSVPNLTKRSMFSRVGTGVNVTETVVNTINNINLDEAANTILQESFLFPDDGSLVDDSETWTLFSRDVSVTDVGNGLYDAVVVDQYVREEITTDCTDGSPTEPDGSGWVLIEDNCGTTDTSLYARTLNVTFVSSTGSLLDDLRRVDLYEIAGFSNGQPLGYDNGMLWNDIFATLCNEQGYTFRSNFFSYNGDGIYPNNTEYIEAKAKLAYVMLFQKSDIIKGDATENATIAEITWKRLIEIARDVWQMYFYITNDNEFWLEHITDKSSETHRDLLVTDPVRQEDTEEYDYNDQNIPRTENHTWMDETQDDDFTGAPIRYTGVCVSGEDDSVDYPIREVSTDFPSSLERPDLFSLYGFFMFVTELVDDEYGILSEAGVITGETKMNATLSWANIHDKWWKNNRYETTGFMNNSLTDFGVRRQKRQVPVEAIVSVDDMINFEFSKLLGTSMGSGELRESTWELPSEKAVFNTVHE